MGKIETGDDSSHLLFDHGGDRFGKIAVLNHNREDCATKEKEK